MASRATRPSWQGHLRLSLVTCPVALYPAVSAAETVRFKKAVDASTGDEVVRAAHREADRAIEAGNKRRAA